MVGFCTVVHRLAAYGPDGPDAGYDPDLVRVDGEVTLTPLDQVVEVDEDTATTLVCAPITVPIVDGTIRWRGEDSVRILAGIRWRATWSAMQSAGWPFTLNPRTFTADPGTTIDLSEAHNG